MFKWFSVINGDGNKCKCKSTKERSAKPVHFHSLAIFIHLYVKCIPIYCVAWYQLCAFLAQFISFKVILLRHLFGQIESPNVLARQFFPFVLILFIFRRKFILSQTIHFELISYGGLCLPLLLCVLCWSLCMGTEMMASSCLANTTLTNFFSFHQSGIFSFVAIQTRCFATKSLNSLSCCCGCWWFFFLSLSLLIVHNLF